MPSLTIRDATEADFPALIQLNESEIPHVGSLTAPLLLQLFRESIYFRVAVSSSQQIAGFVLALDQNANYSSPNFIWFRERYPSFVYIDRVLIDSKFRSQGVGRSLYDDLEKATKQRSQLITCEVNINPPNPTSVAFHERLGFAQVGVQDTDGGKKTVSLMAKQLHE